MGWPYDASLSLSPDEKLARRAAIDFYACVAHYSALAPIAVLLGLGLARRLGRLLAGPHPRDGHGHGPYDHVPPSPLAKAHRRHAPLDALAARARRLRWWLCDDVRLARLHLGQRQEWLLGSVWAAWLLALCVVGTGKDFLHLTKRFGAIAVSQLPVQYLLSLKALNPYAFALRTSHEDVNRHHRVLGRIVHLLLVLHMLAYNYYFIVAGVWFKRFFAPVVFLGVVAFAALNALSTTSLAPIRHISYRLFFLVHVFAAVLIPVLVFFHAPSARLYVVEALAVLGLDIGLRRARTITAPSTVEAVPGTDLIKISAALPLRRLTSFKNKPGSHVYLSAPPGSRMGARIGVFDLLFNPFTVASVDEHRGNITLVARVRNGPMTLLLKQHAAAAPVPFVPLVVDGPYGAMVKRFHHLLSWGAARILLVAGGVGATFALPVYQALVQELPSAKVQLIWAVRNPADATWAVSSGGQDGAVGRSMLDDDNVQIFLTGDMDASDESENAPLHAGAVELTALSSDSASIEGLNRRRPELDKIVDATFRQGLEEPVAVLVCGPVDMAREVRRRVRPWAMRGRKVWWHSESFGW